MRLIDADELMEHAWRDKLDSRELIAEMIENAPTIKEIPTRIPIDVFEKLISQQPRWIPVSERLPEGDDFVLVTCKMPYGNLCTYLEILRRTNNGSWTDNLDYYSPDSVIAWMPLPEPYKAESEVEE